MKEEEVSGLEHLANRPVALFIDGDFIGDGADGGRDDLVVSETGTLAIPKGSTQVTVGVSYTFTLRTLPHVMQAPSADLAFDSRKRHARVGVRGVFSRPPIIQGNRPGDRSSTTLMDTVGDLPQLFDVDLTGAGFDTEGSVTIEETLPVPTLISAIYTKITSDKL